MLTSASRKYLFVRNVPAQTGDTVRGTQNHLAKELYSVVQEWNPK